MKYLSIFDVKKNDWSLLPGDYTIMVGGSSQESAAEAGGNAEVGIGARLKSSASRLPLRVAARFHLLHWLCR